jgi:hypothetical protein
VRQLEFGSLFTASVLSQCGVATAAGTGQRRSPEERLSEQITFNKYKLECDYTIFYPNFLYSSKIKHLHFQRIFYHLIDQSEIEWNSPISGHG